jgi:PAS domain S-box-containing protein
MVDYSLRLLHQLEVHQIELEMQNAELLRLKEQAELEAEQSIELYDSSPSGYFTLSRKGEILALNLAGAKILGKDRSLLKKRLLHLQLSDASKPVFLLFLEKVFKSQTSETCEVTLPNDGNPLLYIRLTGIISQDGELSQITAVDITERRQALNKLLDEQAFRKSIESSLSSGIAIVDDKERQIYVNPSFCKMVGWSAEELTGKTTPFAYWPTDQLQAIGEAFQLTLANKAPKEGFELEFVRKDGVRIPSQVIISPFNDGKQRIGWMANVIDITERKKAEESIHNLNWRLEGIIEGTHVGTWEWNVQTGETVFNEEWAKIIGYSIKELAPVSINTWEAHSHPDDLKQSKEQLERHYSGELPYYDYECRMKHKDSHWVWVHDRGRVISRTSDGKPLMMFGTHSDITKRKMAEEEIKLKNEELQKLNAEKDKFFSIIAHDLRGPMGGFMQLTELLVDESHNLTGSEIKELMIDLSQSSRNTFNLLENLLEWSQISSGHLDFKPERVGLNEVVTASIHILAEQAREKEIKIVKAMTNDPMVTADKNMLKSIISNLLTNAIKFTACGGTVTISAKSVENNQTLISVRDTGIGMSEEMKDNLFRIDANTKRPGTQGERSTGLGLLLCKEFVEKHGGKISVESRQRMGSVFSFTLPSANEIWPKKNEEIKEKLHVGKMSSLKNLNILVVEDDDISFKLISVMVKGFSSHLYRAKTGYEAVDVFGQTPGIDLIIMDIKMPEMDGFEATREIRLLNQEVIILAVTTFSMPSDRENSIEAGCNDYMAKPIQPDVFLKMVKKYMI